MFYHIYSPQFNLVLIYDVLPYIFTTVQLSAYLWESPQFEGNTKLIPDMTHLRTCPSEKKRHVDHRSMEDVKEEVVKIPFIF